MKLIIGIVIGAAIVAMVVAIWLFFYFLNFWKA